jgi:hypothetical protein
MSTFDHYRLEVVFRNKGSKCFHEQKHYTPLCMNFQTVILLDEAYHTLDFCSLADANKISIKVSRESSLLQTIDKVINSISTRPTSKTPLSKWFLGESDQHFRPATPAPPQSPYSAVISSFQARGPSLLVTVEGHPPSPSFHPLPAHSHQIVVGATPLCHFPSSKRPVHRAPATSSLPCCPTTPDLPSRGI